MATHDDRTTGYSDEGPYPASGGVHHFDDGTTAFDKKTNAFDTSAYTPVDQFPTAAAHLDEEDTRRPFGWTAGPDIGLLVLRLALGGAFVLHGLQKVFGLFGGPGVDKFAQALQDMGFREAKVLAWVTGVTELAGGGLLVLGLFTPLAAAGLLGVMANVLVLRWRSGFFAPGGVELEAAYAAMAFGLLFAGPGRVALDRGRTWFRRPLLWGFLCLVLAAGATAATLYVFRNTH
ncbi:DoxX family membrane protein [Saccharothrix violaceirubra]|uniref:Putative oxidoreductase n=1 Tax=Saccharothrix violaceirubra TaxID=413306 RepID=A0A7W7SZH2_9PSEU|nr:DoxX family protein [Saccharothrix violaceirubra]MBB4963715.1 putative oxidoreductase [Saccharothrix violaceirubra]